MAEPKKTEDQPKKAEPAAKAPESALPGQYNRKRPYTTHISGETGVIIQDGVFFSPSTGKRLDPQPTVHPVTGKPIEPKK